MSIYQPILNQIRTKDEVDQLKDEIEILLKSLFQFHKSFEEILKTKVRKSTAEILKQSMKPASRGEQVQDMVQNDKPKEFLNGLKEELEKLRVLKVTLSFYPTQNSIDKLFSWVNSNLGKGIILDIEEDPSIMGGAIIEYMGKYLNVSLRKRVEEVFEGKRIEIASLLSC